MSKQVSFKVNDKTLVANEGDILLKVLLDNGVGVPHFCYHDSLGPDGNCRMCMVEIKGQKRPQISCDTFIKEGMEVSTISDNINKVKTDILELELINHPVDCPICDQAGECSLQNYYMDYGLHQSRVNKAQKTRKGKKLDIGRNIMLDQERCVLCMRCVRFTQDITKTNELCVEGRGHEARITTVPGESMQTPYAMNVVDLCPVGALTSKDFRFKQRVWFMKISKSICQGCAKGCNIYIDHNAQKYQSDQIYRLRPRLNHEVNTHFMCDEGRLSFKIFNESRLSESYQKQNAITIDTALSSLLRLIRDEKPLFILSPSLSLEELRSITLLAKTYDVLCFSPREGYVDEDFGDDWLRSSDRSANRASIKLLAINENYNDLLTHLDACDSVINFDHEFFLKPSDDVKLFLNNKSVAHLSTHKTDFTKTAHIQIPFRAYSESEGTIINEDNRLQKMHTSILLDNDVQDLLTLLHTIHAASPKDAHNVWTDSLHEVDVLKDISFDTIPDQGVQLCI